MKDIAELALDVAVSSGANYADCRVVQRGIQALAVKDGSFAAVSSFEDEGVGIRVIVDGGWGFAGVDRLDLDSLGEAARTACRIARASSRLRRQAVRLAPCPVAVGEYRTPFERDPFEVSLEEKMDLLIRADEAMASVEGVTTHEASLEFVREHRLFASSEGSVVEQVLVQSGEAWMPPPPAPTTSRPAASPTASGATRSAQATRRSKGWTSPAARRGSPPRRSPC